MISGRRIADGSFVVVSGHMRLKVHLELDGKVEVVDLGTGQTIHVHEVEGRMLALSEESQANIEDLANAAINRARN